MNGNYIKATTNRGQSNDLTLLYFVIQLVEDAVQSSTLDLLQQAKVVPREEYANQFQSKVPALITVHHEIALNRDNSIDKLQTVNVWAKTYDIYTSISTTQYNDITIKQVHKEMKDLLLYNTGEYSNINASGAVTERFKTRPTKNKLVEENIFYEAETLGQRPNYLTSILSIQFNIYK